MSIFSKQAPLETYLRGVAIRNPREGDAGEGVSPSDQVSPVDSRRVVILTILDQRGGPMSEDDLKRRSELRDGYAKTMDGLQSEGLIACNSEGFSLTEKGREVAGQERARLLGI